MSKRDTGRKTQIVTYRIVETDDDGSREFSSGSSSPRSAASSLAGIVDWVDVEDFAANWIAIKDDGSVRYELGVDE